jgi:hypothetical protein
MLINKNTEVCARGVNSILKSRKVLGFLLDKDNTMLEYLDNETRISLLSIIYDDYVKTKSKNVTYGITSKQTIADWENFRYLWLRTNLIDKLEAIKNNG